MPTVKNPYREYMPIMTVIVPRIRPRGIKEMRE
jgi:hypothetical protein